MTIFQFDVEKNELIVREPNLQELAQWELDKAQGEAEANAIAQATAARAALLAKLGITEEEARLLLGGN